MLLVHFSEVLSKLEKSKKNYHFGVMYLVIFVKNFQHKIFLWKKLIPILLTFYSIPKITFELQKKNLEWGYWFVFWPKLKNINLECLWHKRKSLRHFVWRVKPNVNILKLFSRQKLQEQTEKTLRIFWVKSINFFHLFHGFGVNS